MTTIAEAVEQYLGTVTRRSSNRAQKKNATARSYRNGLNTFRQALKDAQIDPGTTDVSTIREDWIDHLIDALNDKSPATENLYLSAASNFYHYLAAHDLAEVNLPRLKELINQRARKLGRRIPQFPRGEIERLIAYAESLATRSVEDTGATAKTETGRIQERKRERLRNMRDRAFILFLADTGLRCSEACSLTLGDVNFLEGRLTVIGKGDAQAAVRISERALTALKEYLELRKTDVRAPGRKTKSLPLFTRHDRGATEALGRIASSTAWDLVKARAVEAVGAEAAALIHPHSFRHYFVTVVLLATRNMEIARRLARHKSIAVTQRYAEVDPELDEEYHQIFNHERKNLK
jgi:integrase/recombinase XerC